MLLIHFYQFKQRFNVLVVYCTALYISCNHMRVCVHVKIKFKPLLR